MHRRRILSREFTNFNAGVLPAPSALNPLALERNYRTKGNWVESERGQEEGVSTGRSIDIELNYVAMHEATTA